MQVKFLKYLSENGMLDGLEVKKKIEPVRVTGNLVKCPGTICISFEPFQNGLLEFLSFLS